MNFPPTTLHWAAIPDGKALMDPAGNVVGRVVPPNPRNAHLGAFAARYVHKGCGAYTVWNTEERAMQSLEGTARAYGHSVTPS